MVKTEKRMALLLLISIILLAASLICLSKNATIVAEDNSDRQNILSYDDIDIDMSVFKEKPLPNGIKENKTLINEDNIGQYVPTDFFNAANGMISYIGRYYGFVLEIDNGRNRVLIFSIEYINEFVDNSSFSIKIEVVYHNAFSKTALGIKEIEGVEHLALAIPSIESLIIEAGDYTNPIIGESHIMTRGAFFCRGVLWWRIFNYQKLIGDAKS